MRDVGRSKENVWVDVRENDMEAVPKINPYSLKQGTIWGDSHF